MTEARELLPVLRDIGIGILAVWAVIQMIRLSRDMIRREREQDASENQRGAAMVNVLLEQTKALNAMAENLRKMTEAVQQQEARNQERFEAQRVAMLGVTERRDAALSTMHGDIKSLPGAVAAVTEPQLVTLRETMEQLLSAMEERINARIAGTSDAIRPVLRAEIQALREQIAEKFNTLADVSIALDKLMEEKMRAPGDEATLDAEAQDAQTETKKGQEETNGRKTDA